MKILVIGGFGYLGSIVTDMLARKGHEVDVCDVGLFDNSLIEVEYNKPFKFRNGILDIYECIVWAATIDCQQFYETDLTAKFLTESKEFFYLASKIKTRFINCSSYLLSYRDIEKSPMIEYMAYLEDIVIQNYQYNIRVPSLYGPSPRMRWDTTFNEIFFTFTVANRVMLQDDWAIKIPLASVFDMASFICRECEGPLSDGQVNYATDIMNQLEIAYKIRSCLNKDFEIDALGDPLEMYFEDSKIYPKTQGILDVCKNFKINLENNALPDFMMDKYNNETMIRNAIVSASFLEKIKG